jgi:UTP-glucose-1-phosphate uridylyltransferase
LCRIHGVPSVEIYVSKDTPKLVSRLIGTPPKKITPNILPIIQLIEKPASTHSIFRSTRAFGIVGRYLLRPDIFRPLRELKEMRELKEKEPRPVQLTTALEQLRQAGQRIYVFELKAVRRDVGEVLGQASKLIGDSSKSSSAS